MMKSTRAILYELIINETTSAYHTGANLSELREYYKIWIVMIDDVPVVVLLDEHRVAVERVLHARARHARAEVREHEDLQQRVHPLHRREQERLRLRAPHRIRFVPEL